MENILSTDCPKLYLDGVLSDTYHIIVAERPKIPSPQQISHSNDSMLSDRGTAEHITGYQNIDISVVFNYLEDVSERQQTFRMAFGQIRGVLFNTQRLQFNDDPTTHYKVRKVTIDDAENDIVEYGQFTVKFTCAPFAYMNDDTNPVQKTMRKITNNASYGVSELVVVNDGYYKSYPKITVELSKGTFSSTTDRMFSLSLCPVAENGSIDRTVGNALWAIRFKTIPSGYDIIIDSEATIIYAYNPTTKKVLQGSLMIDSFIVGDFPELLVGPNALVLGQFSNPGMVVPVSVERNRVV